MVTVIALPTGTDKRSAACLFAGQVLLVVIDHPGDRSDISETLVRVGDILGKDSNYERPGTEDHAGVTRAAPDEALLVGYSNTGGYLQRNTFIINAIGHIVQQPAAIGAGIGRIQGGLDIDSHIPGGTQVLPAREDGLATKALHITGDAPFADEIAQHIVSNVVAGGNGQGRQGTQGEFIPILDAELQDAATALVISSTVVSQLLLPVEDTLVHQAIDEEDGR